MKFNSLVQLGLLIPVAILIWLAVFSLSYQTFNLDIPITIKGLKSGLAVDENITTVAAAIRAKSMTYYQLRLSKSSEAVIDLSFIEGPGSYNVKPQITLGINSVWLVSFTPSVLALTVVPAVSATVPVVIDPVGFPADGYALGDLTAAPGQVAIIGPASLVNTTEQAYVTVDVSGKQASFVAKASPAVRDAQGYPLANVRFNPAEINVNVVVAKGATSKTVGLVPTFSGSLPSGYWISEIEFNPPAVSLESNMKKLEAISNVKTTPINLAGKTDNFSDQVGLVIPAGVTLVGENLINVMVKLSSSPFNRKLSLIPHGINVAPGFKVVSINPSLVDVSLAGAAGALDKADRSNVVLDLDLRTATSGDNTINIDAGMFRVPEGISVISFEPAALQVSLTKTN